MWPRFLRTYFAFTKQQGRGLFVLICLCLALVLIRLILPLFEPKPGLVLKNLPYIYVDSGGIEEKTIPTQNNKEKQQLSLFAFDPNRVTYDEALQLGLKPHTAKALMNFRNKGFVFREKKDLKKVYGLSPLDYERLEPYIQISEAVKNTESELYTRPTASVSQTKKPIPISLELNTADSVSLIALNGIGPAFARRILKYRALLGGYFKTEQLKEVYGFTDELYEKMHPYITIDTQHIHQIRINSDDFKTLNRHPYLSYELTKQVVNARKNRRLDEAAFRDLINDEVLFQKLRPYCAFD